MTPVGFEPMAARLLVQPCIHMTTSARWSIDANIGLSAYSVMTSIYTYI